MPDTTSNTTPTVIMMTRRALSRPMSLMSLAIGLLSLSSLDLNPIQMGYAEPAETESTQAEPTQAEPTQAEPTQAEPTQAEPTQAKPAQSAHPKLTLAKLLERLESSHPKNRSAAESARSAQAEERAARGAWDPQLNIYTSGNPVSAYERLSLNGQVRQALPLWGMDLYAGYRVTAGELPIYREELMTLSAGEVSAGLDVELLAGRALDKRRALIRAREQASMSAVAQRAYARVFIERDAALAYWSWVSARALHLIQLELLEMAQARSRALELQVEYGSKAPIIVLDNKRLILERAAEEVSAGLKLRAAAYKLSLYYRDVKTRAPVIPKALSAPKLPTPPEGFDASAHPEDEVQLLSEHPLLVASQRKVESQRVKLELADAQRAPKLTAGTYVSQDLGEVQRAQDNKLGYTELGVSLKLDVPLGLTAATAEVERARAELVIAQEKLRGLQDQLIASLRAARAALEADIVRSKLAGEQVKVARALLEAERIKLEEGASDLVILNLRERAYAKAEASEVKAIAHYHQSWARYVSAKGQALSEHLTDVEGR